MADITSDNFLTIQGWMVTELGLKGNELLVYAAIYGFTQDENQWFTGSRQYLSGWTGSTKQTVGVYLKSLTEKGLIEKRERFDNGVKFCDYQVKNSTRVGEKFTQGGLKIHPGGGLKIHHHNNILHNEIDNKNKNYNSALDDLFESLWNLYPVKKGKGQVTKSAKSEHFKIGQDEMERAINRYLSDLKKDAWRKPQNGSTFFNSGYIDYLDKNYVPTVNKREQALRDFLKGGDAT